MYVSYAYHVCINHVRNMCVSCMYHVCIMHVLLSYFVIFFFDVITVQGQGRTTVGPHHPSYPPPMAINILVITACDIIIIRFYFLLFCLFCVIFCNDNILHCMSMILSFLTLFYFNCSICSRF